jgi:hypothetical protein
MIWCRNRHDQQGGWGQPCRCASGPDGRRCRGVGNAATHDNSERAAAELRARGADPDDRSDHVTAAEPQSNGGGVHLLGHPYRGLAGAGARRDGHRHRHISETDMRLVPGGLRPGSLPPNSVFATGPSPRWVSATDGVDRHAVPVQTGEIDYFVVES